MNPFEKQVRLGRELFELNVATWQRVAELNAESFRKYVETNQSFVEKLPEVKDLSGFVSLQREYGETLWNGAQDVLKTRGEILRETTEQAGKLFRGAYVTGESAEETPEVVAA